MGPPGSADRRGEHAVAGDTAAAADTLRDDAVRTEARGVDVAVAVDGDSVAVAAGASSAGYGDGGQREAALAEQLAVTGDASQSAATADALRDHAEGAGAGRLHAMRRDVSTPPFPPAPPAPLPMVILVPSFRLMPFWNTTSATPPPPPMLCATMPWLRAPLVVTFFSAITWTPGRRCRRTLALVSCDPPTRDLEQPCPN